MIAAGRLIVEALVRVLASVLLSALMGAPGGVKELWAEHNL
ncbi:hypothetical protein [Sphingopyxis sp. Geo48]|jgi:predicted Kef-type K+ transport protein|nr:hypothetical protein [Sphingopyxis sp. Geo48]